MNAAAKHPHRLTPDERAARGRAARKAVPREQQARFDPSASRPDPVSLLERQAADRITDLVPIRYGRMLASPFAYYRGAALPMAADLSGTPASGLTTQLCGDAHLSNFGVYASPERRLVFDVNDFDETAPGPWEWDVKRLAASLEIAAQGNGCPAKVRRDITVAAVARYRAAMRDFAQCSDLDVWYAHAELDELPAAMLAPFSPAAATPGGAHPGDNQRELRKLTHTEQGSPRFNSSPPLLVPVDELTGTGQENVAQLTDLVSRYRDTLETDRQFLLDRFEVVDLARRVVGVGSVGTRCYVALLLGRDDDDPLFLQVKEAGPSVLQEFTGPGQYASGGQRVVAGQRLMQASSDIFLGWHTDDAGPGGAPRDFYVRQLRDGKQSAEIGSLDPAALRRYGQLCGWTLARAHARSGDRIAIAAYLGGSDVLDRAIADFATRYADQNERDLAALAAARKAGRIIAETGV
jgi:uncharacterized protein (DUF2252 family)